MPTISLASDSSTSRTTADSSPTTSIAKESRASFVIGTVLGAGAASVIYGLAYLLNAASRRAGSR